MSHLTDARLPTLPARMKVRAARCPGAAPEQVRAQHVPWENGPVAPALSTLLQCTSHSLLQGRDVVCRFCKVKNQKRRYCEVKNIWKKKLFFLVQILLIPLL